MGSTRTENTTQPKHRPDNITQFDLMLAFLQLQYEEEKNLQIID